MSAVPKCGEHPFTYVATCSSCRATRKINEQIAAGTFRVEIVGQHEVTQFEPEIRQLLDLLGHPEAMVTDLSRIRDFLPFVPGDTPRFTMRGLRKVLGVAVASNDLLIDVAVRMRAKK